MVGLSNEKVGQTRKPNPQTRMKSLRHRALEGPAVFAMCIFCETYKILGGSEKGIIRRAIQKSHGADLWKWDFSFVGYGIDELRGGAAI